VSVSTSRWGGSHELQLLTEEEVEELPEAKGYTKNKGRYLACQPTEPFNYEDTVTVKIGPKVRLALPVHPAVDNNCRSHATCACEMFQIPSAEGPALSPETSTFSFTVVPKFAVLGTRSLPLPSQREHAA
jgi:hypothetical protein